MSNSISLSVVRGVRMPTLQEIRGRASSMYIPWDDMAPGIVGSGDLGDCIPIPAEFWVGRGMTEDEVHSKEGLTAIKDKIRRNFYAWRDKEPSKRSGIGLTLIDRRNDAGRYTETIAYMIYTGTEQTEEVAKEVQKNARVRQATTKKKTPTKKTGTAEAA